MRDASEARDALRAGSPEMLAGTRECAWLDAKGQPYQLDQPRSAAELAKDVAALANTGGGVIVIGLRTRREGSSEVIDEVRPVPASLIDRDRYRKLVRERVFPFVRDFATWWIPVGDERGLLVIDVPAQASKDKPFVVSGSDGTQAAVDASSVAVPLRDDDGTHWLSGQELHRLLTDGWNVSGPPAPRVVVASNPAPAIAAGEGDPLWSQEFREAYDAAGGRHALGMPAEPVTPAGPGVIQRLTGGSPGSAAICAVPDFKPVVLAGDAWKFILKQCRDASPADYLALAGLPVTDETGHREGQVIRLSGGEWGPGELVQDTAGSPWRWRPVPMVDTAPAFQADRWSHVGGPGTEPDLVVRADAFLPWRGSASWRIDKRGRERLVAALTAAGLVPSMLTLAGRRGITNAQPPPWEFLPERDGGRQSERTAQYRCVVRAPDGTPALTAEARLVLPDGYQRQSVQASAALKIRFASIEDADGAADPRLTLAELLDVFAAAWETAMLVIPVALVEDPAVVPLSGPPVAELYVRAGERYVDGRPEYKDLLEVMDLSPLGKVTGSQLRQGGISVTAPLESSSEERRLLVRTAVARMAASQWGFIEVDDDLDF